MGVSRIKMSSVFTRGFLMRDLLEHEAIFLLKV